MSSITVHIDKAVKSQAQQKTKQDGVTLTFVITQALKAYSKGKIKFGLHSSDFEEKLLQDLKTTLKNI